MSIEGKEGKEGKEASREKLIRELQDLGQLIAPDDSPASATDSPSEPAPSHPPLEEAFDDGTIEPPRVAPEWVQELDCLAAFLTVSGLVTRIDLDAVELDDFSRR